MPGMCTDAGCAADWGDLCMQHAGGIAAICWHCHAAAVDIIAAAAHAGTALLPPCLLQCGCDTPRLHHVPALQGMEGGTPSPGSYVTPSPGSRLSAPPPPAPKGAGAGAARPAWPATTSPAPLPLTTGGGLVLPSMGAPGPQRKFVDEGKLRKVSGKLFAEPASVLKQLRWHGGGEGSSGRAAAEGGDSGGGSLADMAALPGVPRGHRSPEGQAQALPLLQALGEGYRLLCMYRWGGVPGWLCW